MASQQKELKRTPSTGPADRKTGKSSSPANEFGQLRKAGGRNRNNDEDVPGEGGLDEPTAESQTHSRGGKGARGSNH
jgi:hypothetical protein